MRSARLGAAFGLIVALLAVGGLTTGDAGRDAAGRQGIAADGDFRPGGPGIGDTYFPEHGNGGYDVSHYHVAISYDPASGRLDGYAVITATATQSLSRFNLDFSDLTVFGATVDGAPAVVARRGRSELVITPPTGLPAGRRFSVAVRYGGVPGTFTIAGTGQLSGFLRGDDGGVVIGEPEAATAWFPVNDHPRDKATYDIEARVPDGLTAVAGGVPVGSDSRDGWTTWRWSVRQPMASYLATVAIGRFRVTTGVHNGLTVYNAVAASLPDHVDRAIARTPEIVDFLASKFGPYPFDAIGAIVPDLPQLSIAMETQTRPVYSARYFGGAGTQVIVHEMAHQWFGNSVSVRDWRDVWLNEGFATYAEWLWHEHQGANTVSESFQRAYGALPGDSVWSAPPGNPGPARLFSKSVYQRGAMTLQALRITVGDETFFTILRGWAAAKRHGNGTTAEFVGLAEQLSGRRLGGLFHAWLYTSAKPPPP